MMLYRRLQYHAFLALLDHGRFQCRDDCLKSVNENGNGSKRGWRVTYPDWDSRRLDGCNRTATQSESRTVIPFSSSGIIPLDHLGKDKHIKAAENRHRIGTHLVKHILQASLRQCRALDIFDRSQFTCQPLSLLVRDRSLLLACELLEVTAGALVISRQGYSHQQWGEASGSKTSQKSAGGGFAKM